MNLFQALENGYNLLKTNNINSYKIDTELLLSDSLNISNTVSVVCHHIYQLIK